MRRTIFAALIASLGAAALMLPATASFAGSPTAATHPTVHPHFAHRFAHHRRFAGGTFWPGDYGYSYGQTYDQAPVQVAPSLPTDFHYTYTYDVPWDWAHRYPPMVVPSDHAYVTSCPTQVVRVGGGRTVNVIRCY
ncbi:MAG: hypothetical protein ACREDC_11865 [Bradyrhizobium sp.]